MPVQPSTLACNEKEGVCQQRPRLVKIGRHAYLAVDELDVARALRVAVAGTVLGTSLVGREARQAAVLVHLRQVERAVEAARQVRHVDVEGELLVQQLEHLVVRVVRHQVHTRADVRARHELERERVAGGRDAVRARVVRAVERAVLRARRPVGAQCRVPRVAGVAVGVTGGAVQPPPVGVEHDLGAQRLAAAGLGALLRGHHGVVLGRVRADLLAGHDGEVCECGEGECAEHCRFSASRS